jgi:redox-sensitive bicupin YhaK (pirin superfamily)
MWLRARSISRRDIRWARLLIFRPGDRITVRATRRVRAIFLGVAALEATLHLVEFCLLAQERIEQAKEDWKTGKFAPVPGETEFL